MTALGYARSNAARTAAGTSWHEMSRSCAEALPAPAKRSTRALHASLQREHFIDRSPPRAHTSLSHSHARLASAQVRFWIVGKERLGEHLSLERQTLAESLG